MPPQCAEDQDNRGFRIVDCSIVSSPTGHTHGQASPADETAVSELVTTTTIVAAAVATAATRVVVATTTTTVAGMAAVASNILPVLFAAVSKCAPARATVTTVAAAIATVAAIAAIAATAAAIAPVASAATRVTVRQLAGRTYFVAWRWLGQYNHTAGWHVLGGYVAFN